MSQAMRPVQFQAAREWLSSGTQRRISSVAIPAVQHPRTRNIKPLNQNNGKALYSTRTHMNRQTKKSSPFSIHRSLSHQYMLSSRRDLSNGQAFSSSARVATQQPTIHNVFEPVTGTWQFVVSDPSTKSAVIIDPVLDYDPATQAITTDSADKLLALVKDKGYTVERILETHAHADHLTSASYLQKKLSEIQDFKPPIGIGKRIEKVQKLFGKRYGVSKEEYDTVFDNLFEDDESFTIGNVTAKAIHLPGHTPDHLGYRIGDNIFCGDSLFHADIGTARCDFPGGNAKDLFQSSRKILSLGDHVKIWPGHDYPPAGRDPIPWLSVADHREQNKHVRDTISEEEFVALRTERDANLNAPRLLHQSLQINIRAGRLPAPLESGHRLLHLPLKLNGLDW